MEISTKCTTALPSLYIQAPGKAKFGRLPSDMPRTKPTTLDRFGRLLIPKTLRDAAGLRTGVEVEIVADDEGLRLIPRRRGVLLKEVDGVLIAAGEAAGDLASAVRHDREKRVRRLLGRRR